MEVIFKMAKAKHARDWIVLLVGLWLPVAAVGQARIEINNPSAFDRREEVVAVPWRDVVSAYPAIDTASLVITDGSTRRQLPYQYELKGGRVILNLLVQVSIAAKTKAVLKLRRGRPETFKAKTFCRYVPERKDDFAWENDKIGFRTYGKALENTNENAYGLDVWVKRKGELVIDRRYRRNDYHKDHGDGLDYYSVGFTLGAGGIAPYAEDSVWYPANYRHWEILDNGPLRSTFRLEYDTWKVQEKEVRLVLTMSIDAGSQLHKVVGIYTYAGSDPLPVAVGIVKRKAPGTSLLDEQKGLMGYWEPADKENGTTGIGCVLERKEAEVLLKEGQWLSVFSVDSGKPFVYYRGAAWDKAGVITTAGEWFRYLNQYHEKIKNPLQPVVLATR